MHTPILRRVVLAIPLVTAILFFTPGCSGGSNQESKSEGKTTKGTTSVSFLTMQLRPTFDSFFNPIFKEYETAHPDVHINWLDYPYQNYETKLMTSFMTGNSPDVINIASDSVPSFEKAGLLRDIDGLLPPEVINSYLPNVIHQGCMVNGKPYALPWYVAGTVTFYNKKLFKQAGIDLKTLPQDYSELPALIKTIHEKTGAFGYFPLYTESGVLRSYLLEAGVPLVDKSGTKAVFDTPKGVKILKFWTDLYKEHLVPSEALTAMHRRPIELYKAGKLAILETGPQFLKQIKSDAPDVYSNTIVGPDLGWKDANVQLLVLQAICISAQSKNPKQAADFAAFITNAKNQLAFCKQTVILPSVKAALEDPYFTHPEDTLEGQARKLSAQEAKTGTIPPVPKDSRKLFKVFDDVTEQVALDKMTAADGLAKAQKEWNRILAEGWQPL